MKHFNMAITSPTKKSDLELLTIHAETIEITHRAFLKNPDLEQYLISFITTYRELKHRIDAHDYTADDATYWRTEAIFRRKGLSPVDA